MSTRKETRQAERAARLDANWKRTFRRRLMAWYADNARDLPWRRTRDPYRVWVSEVMLQQTQAATVIPYFQRFIAAFPSIRALAAASEGDVLQLWEGLGYYRRARQLHAAARQLVEDHDGRLPQDVGELSSLPGIGRYTAGAIASIAWDARQSILEANTVRLWCRLLAYEGDPTTAAGQLLLWAAAKEILPKRQVGVFNQALMELGSQVCLPKDPRCGACPVAPLCPTRTRGLQAAIPRNKRPVATTAVREAAVVIRHRGKVLILHGDDGRWAGLWDFPRFRLSNGGGAALGRELTKKVAELTGVLIEPGDRLLQLRHGVTRFRITLDCFEARYVSRRGPSPRRHRWVGPARLQQYPLHVTGRRLAERLAGSEI